MTRFTESKESNSPDSFDLDLLFAPPGIGATAIAERSVAALRDREYQGAVLRHVRICGFGIVAGVFGAALALWMLRAGDTVSPQATQFWLLVFVLGGGMAGVALLVGGGLMAEQSAISRLAVAYEQNSLIEALRDSDVFRRKLDEIEHLVIRYPDTEPSHEPGFSGEFAGFVVRLRAILANEPAQEERTAYRKTV